MFPPLDHFWGQIVQCAAHGFPPIRGRMDAPSKVTDFEFAIDPDEEIFRFDIPVDYVFGVEVDESVGHLVDIDSTSSFGKAAVLHELLVHLTLSGEFKHEKDAVLVVEVAVETKDVGMSQVLLDLDFASDLFLNPRLYNFLLVETLEGKDIVGFDLCPNHVDVPKPAFTQRTTDVKVIQVPIAGWPFPVKEMRIGQRQRWIEQEVLTLSS